MEGHGSMSGRRRVDADRVGQGFRGTGVLKGQHDLHSLREKRMPRVPIREETSCHGGSI